MEKSVKVIGLMSGTSVDSVDAALVQIFGSGTSTKVELLDFISFNFPKGMKEMILENAETNGGNVTTICKLNFLIAQVYVKAVQKLLRKNNLEAKDIFCIGSHGQTVHHLPNEKKLFGLPASSTLQIGDPSVLAKLTGILTVGDFRVADIALGGQGAPLVPYFDYLIFRSKTKNRGLLNIGGIANISVIKRNSQPDDVIAFDTGPGNMMIDALMKIFFNKQFDNNGRCAAKGKVNIQLLAKLLESDKFINLSPPKSTGREYYGKLFLQKLLKEFSRLKHNDWIATISEYTALTIYFNYVFFILPKIKLDELLVSGGGAKNKFLLSTLQHYFGSVTVIPIEQQGFSSDAKEAICFAVLANETMNNFSSNLPQVTGAKRRAVLGKICPA